MQELIIYLLKSSGLISLFYVGYYLLLKNDTSFWTNRFYLLAGIITSLLLPSLQITRNIVAGNSARQLSESFSGQFPDLPVVQSGAVDWWQVAGILYLIGLTFFLLKFFLELVSLLKLIYTNKSARTKNYTLIQKPGISQPFSFFRYIVLDPAQHSPGELDIILKHEQAHVRQWHSLDQLLSSLSVYIFWFNPLCRLYRKSMVQNLEYLADQEVIDAQVSKKKYQQALLKICTAGFQPALTNHFYQSLIKKRIMMLNKNTPQKLNIWKLSLVLPFLAVFIFFFNVKTVAQELEKKIETPVDTKTNPDQKFFKHDLEFKSDDIPAMHLENKDVKIHSFQEVTPLIVVDGKKMEPNFDAGSIATSSIDYIKVLKDETAVEKYGETGKHGVIEIYLKSNEAGKEKKSSSEAKANPTTLKVTKVRFEESPRLSVRDVGNADPDAAQPLYIIDGKVADKDFDPEAIAPENIKSVTVLKGNEAIEKYGEKAKAGAIEITLKKDN